MFSESLIAVLPLAVVIVSGACGLFLLAWWLAHESKPPFLLYWGIGFLFLFTYKLPSVLLHAGVADFTQEDLYPFFFIALILYFIAYFVFIKGLSFLLGGSRKPLFVRLFLLWLPVAIVYFGLTFFAGADTTFAPVWAGHLLFYIPAEIFLLYELWRVVRSEFAREARGSTVTAMFGGVLLFVTSLQYIVVQIYSVKRDYWFYSSITSWEISVMQILAAVFLFIGLYGIAKQYLATLPRS